jgi:hypothetical protein
MVLNTVGAIVAAFLLLYTVATIVRTLGGGGGATLVSQCFVNGAVGYALFSISFVSAPIAMCIAALPVVVRAFAYLWFYRQGKKVLSGDYGESARWAAELVEEGDEEFIEASSQLTRIRLREVGIVSNNKQELRENTIEQAQELEE